MGYLGVPIKPSTILVFSIAFGISVDDTIHFLAKYRQELMANNLRIKKSVYAALKETGVSMFYTSIVLFFGFLFVFFFARVCFRGFFVRFFFWLGTKPYSNNLCFFCVSSFCAGKVATSGNGGDPRYWDW